jgi:hypothetical protein
MFSKTLASALVAGLIAAPVIAPADPGKPNFMPQVYGDGEYWGTKGTTTLPVPNAHNLRSFDKLFIFVGDDVAPGQLPVSEAAPGNPNYSGGRWYTHTAQWNIANPPLIESYEELAYYEESGDLAVIPGSPGGPPMFFQCPLLPVKAY